MGELQPTEVGSRFHAHNHTHMQPVVNDAKTPFGWPALQLGPVSLPPPKALQHFHVVEPSLGHSIARVFAEPYCGGLARDPTDRFSSARVELAIVSTHSIQNIGITRSEL